MVSIWRTAGKLCKIRNLLGLEMVQKCCDSNHFVRACTLPLVIPSASYRTVPKQCKQEQRLAKETHCTKWFSTSLAAAEIQDEHEDDFKIVAEQMNKQLSHHDVGRTFAVVFIEGKQRKITDEDIIIFNKHLAADIGERIVLNKVLMVGSKDFSLIGRPVLSADLVRVEATVLEKTLSYTRVFFKYLRRQNNRKMKLRKDPTTFVRINSIELGHAAGGRHQNYKES